MTEIALAASARDWPDRLHRWVLDHGGARVAGRLMGPSQVMEAHFDVLFIDDVCSFLTPGLVTALRAAGREIVGVFDPTDGPDAKRRLLECGISDVIESDAEPVEFLKVADSVVSTHPIRADATPTHFGRWIGVVGVVDGVGATELATTLSVALSEKIETVLVDLDPMWPSVAQRLDLPAHPNLRTLVDLVVHDGRLASGAMHMAGPLRVVVGAQSGSPIPSHELRLSLGAAIEGLALGVADLGAIDRVSPSLLASLAGMVVVGTADPVGIARLIRVVERVGESAGGTRMLVAVNKASRALFYRAELKAELSKIGVSSVLLPFDPAVTRAAWDGVVPKRGLFASSVRRIATLLGGLAE